jgi:hypothetical protein
LNWIATEYLQERKKTDMGNAITNGVVALWVGIDWTRTLMSKYEGFDVSFAIKFAFCVFLLVYGITIIILGLKGKRIVQFIGRIREITYFNYVFTPIIYGYYDVSWLTIAAIAVYFPIFYIIVEIIDRFLPKPGFEEEGGGGFGEDNLGLPSKEPETDLSTSLEGTGMPGTEAGLGEETGLSGTGAQKQTQQAQQPQVPTCPYCRRPLSYVQQYGRYYCYTCRRYV